MSEHYLSEHLACDKGPCANKQNKYYLVFWKENNGEDESKKNGEEDLMLENNDYGLVLVER